jgi:UDP-N-acetylglucosamine 2-epimerase
MKVMTLVGTRPEIIKLACIIPKLDEYFDHKLVHSGQNYEYELNQVFFDQLELRKPDYYLESAGQTPAETIGNVITKFDKVLELEKPDAVLIYGDTNSCLGAIAAKRKKIPIFHLESGNRCFDLRVPEEINRKIVDHLSDVNFVHSEHARRYLLDEGVRPELIFKSGSPMPEILNKFEKSIEDSVIMDELGVTKGDYFLISIHREENVDYEDNFKSLIDTLEIISKKYKKRVIVSTHPRTRKKLELLKFNASGVEFMKPMGFLEYVKLQRNAYCVLSDSGTLTEESNLLSFPAIMIRQTHERPEGMDVGAVILSGVNSVEILEGITMAVRMERPRLIEDYSNQNVSSQVVKIIQGYTSYINRVNWKK